jgi:hypothetical protein
MLAPHETTNDELEPIESQKGKKEQASKNLKKSPKETTSMISGIRQEPGFKGAREKREEKKKRGFRVQFSFFFCFGTTCDDSARLD